MEPILVVDERSLLTGMLDRQRAEVAALLDDIDESFLVADADTVESVRRAYLEACAHSREVVHGRDLDEEYPWRTVRVSLRFVLVHMVQELARHAGHGDILLEQLRARRNA